MPNRILREGILTSERVNALEWESEVFYRRLMSVVDDFGRFAAHPSLLRAALYPLQLEKVREASISRWLAACEAVGLVRLYTQSGASADRSGNQSGASGDRSGGEKQYLEILDFRQQVRAIGSKYPDPPGNTPQPHSGCVAPATHMRTKTETKAHAETEAGDAADAAPPRKRKPPDSPHHRVIASYSEAFQARYGRKPSIGGREGSVAKDLLARADDEAEACAMVRAFLADGAEKLVKEKHPLSWLVVAFEKYRDKAAAGGGKNGSVRKTQIIGEV
jgi:hypothetical protein